METLRESASSDFRDTVPCTLLTFPWHRYATGSGFDPRTDSGPSGSTVRWTSFNCIPITHILPRARRRTRACLSYNYDTVPPGPGVRTSMGSDVTIENESPSSSSHSTSRSTEPWVTTTHYATQPRYLAERIPVWIQYSQQATSLTTPIGHQRRRLDGPVRTLRKPLLLA